MSFEHGLRSSGLANSIKPTCDFPGLKVCPDRDEHCEAACAPMCTSDNAAETNGSLSDC